MTCNYLPPQTAVYLVEAGVEDPPHDGHEHAVKEGAGPGLSGQSPDGDLAPRLNILQ